MLGWFPSCTCTHEPGLTRTPYSHIMAPRTRSTTSSPIKKTPKTSDHSTATKRNNIKVVIIPKNISADAKILSLRHPRDGNRKKFLFCPQHGLYEFTRTATSPVDPHSMIFSLADSTDAGQKTSVEEVDRFCDGWISKDAEMFIATKFNISFILVGILASRATTTKKTLFQPLDDLLDASEIEDDSLEYIVKHGRQLVEDGMSSICDAVDAGDEKMYRYSEEKAQQMVSTKAGRVAQLGLPASLEDRFVTRTLASPVLSVKREDTIDSIEVTESPKPDENDSQTENLDSQSTTASTTVSVVFSELSAASTATTACDDTIPANITSLQRLRVAQNFIISSYLPSSLAGRFRALMSEGSMAIQFKPLEDYLQRLATLKAEATASRSMADFNRKRGLDEEEAALDRAEKKKKLEEDEKRRKANESRGVRDLKKVNVSGMKKMSDFFTKKVAVAKAKT